MLTCYRLAPGIFVMQFVTIFFPIYEAYESRRHMRTTLSLIKDWEEKGNSGSSASSGDMSRASYTISIRSKEIYSMASLEKALAVNPMPLLHFAASKDFTAENIIFLMRVKEWRQAWATAPRKPGTDVLTEAARSLLFRLAVEIYMTCVVDTISDFPINIEATVRYSLDTFFEHAVPEGKKRLSSNNDASLFDIAIDHNGDEAINSEVKRIALVSQKSGDSADSLWGGKSMHSAGSDKSPSPSHTSAAFKGTDDEDQLVFTPHPAIAPLGSARAKIRPDFDATVFDTAEASIKYLVLTNTWRKFAAEAQNTSSKEALGLV